MCVFQPFYHYWTIQSHPRGWLWHGTIRADRIVDPRQGIRLLNCRGRAWTMQRTFACPELGAARQARVNGYQWLRLFATAAISSIRLAPALPRFGSHRNVRPAATYWETWAGQTPTSRDRTGLLLTSRIGGSNAQRCTKESLGPIAQSSVKPNTRGVWP